MVKGLNNFKEYFRDYKDQFIIIGGTACSLWMDVLYAGPAVKQNKNMVLYEYESFTIYYFVFFYPVIFVYRR